jgi:hypothetical protein
MTFAEDTIQHLDYVMERQITPDNGEVILHIHKKISRKRRPNTGGSSAPKPGSGIRPSGSRFLGIRSAGMNTLLPPTGSLANKSNLRKSSQQLIQWTEQGLAEVPPINDGIRGESIAEVQARYLRTGVCLDLYQQGLPFKVQSEVAIKKGEHHVMNC